MELIIINENKLKIMLTKSDMEFYGLNEDEFYCSITDTKKILKKILHNSNQKTGFETLLPEDKILMQLYPEKGGGCELFVTKLFIDSDEDIFMSRDNEEKYLLPKASSNTVQLKKSILGYKFDSLKNVLLACAELKKRNFEIQSSLYRDSCGKYHLFIKSSSDQIEKSSPSQFLSEFGELENSDSSLLELSEYGKCILKENAVGTLSEI